MIVTARKLARASTERPRQAELKRAVSTAYYALFHAIAQDVADLFVGAAQRPQSDAWVRAYRALQHGEAKTACQQIRSAGVLPPAIIRCANAFILLQEQRHSADYDPAHRVLRADALEAIRLAEAAIHDLKSADRNDRRKFAAQLVFRRRP